MATKKTEDKISTVEIIEVCQKEVTFCIIGETPFIMHAMPEKVQQELMLPAVKSRSERGTTLKHNLPEEFRNSCYQTRADDTPTRLFLPGGMFKKAISSAALDLPGAAKAQIGRWTRIVEDRISLYGVPELFTTMVRNRDINRTPDVRTRAILPEWACIVTVKFLSPQIREKGIVNLMAAAGMMIGVGDWRKERGSGDYGSFRVTSINNPDVKRIMAAGTREAQDEALADPKPYDEESARSLAYFYSETENRGFDITTNRIRSDLETIERNGKK